MALPWPHRSPTLSRVGLQTRAERVAESAPAGLTTALSRVRAVASSPVVALVVMGLGLLALFVVPTIGLLFVAFVVLPVVVFQLRAEQRRQYRLERR